MSHNNASGLAPPTPTPTATSNSSSPLSKDTTTLTLAIALTSAQSTPDKAYASSRAGTDTYARVRLSVKGGINIRIDERQHKGKGCEDNWIR